jgi:hypothetical protein
MFELERIWINLVTAMKILGYVSDRASHLYASHVRGK